MTILVCGGVRSGKSSFAQELTLRLSRGKHYYVATMIPTDTDDQERIRLHLLDRADMGFETIEQGRDILHTLSVANFDAAFLVDSVTALFMNELFSPEANYAMDESAAQRCTEDLITFARIVKNAVFVSDYIFSDSLRYDNATECYRKGLGLIHCALAKACDTVIEVIAGQTIIHKGVLPE